MPHRWILTFLLLLASGLPTIGAQARDDVPEVVRELLEQAERQLDSERIEEAIQTYREAIRLGPAVVDSYLALGSLYHRNGRTEEALAIFEDGLKAASDPRRLLFNAAVLALRLERFEQALDHVGVALQQSPRDADLLSLEAAILKGLGRPDEALKSLLAADKKKSGDPQILFRLGNLHAELGANEEAIKAFRKAVKRDPTLLRAYYNLGAVLFKSQRFGEALNAYQVALRPIDQAFAKGEDVEATHALAYSNLGAIFFREQRWQQAADAYSKALRLDPGLNDALYNLGFIFYQQKLYDTSADAYEKVLAHDPELPLANLHLGLIRHRQDRHQEAAERLQRALPKVSPDELPPALWALAQSQKALTRTADAEATLRRLLDLEADHLPAQLDLARLLRASDRTREARDLLRQAESGHAGDLTVLLELAGLARLEGDRGAEQLYYEKVLTAGRAEAHRLWPARLRLVLMLLEEGDVTTSGPHLRQLSRLASEGGAEPPIDGRQKAVIKTLEGVVQLANGQTKEARSSLRAAVAEGGENAEEALLLLRASEGEANAVAADLQRRDVHQDPVLAANLAQVLWLSGRGEEARPLLQRAVGSLTTWPSLHAALGDLELRAGRTAEAEGHLEQATDLCQAHGGRPAAPAAGEGRFAVLLGGDSRRLCQWVEGALAVARIRNGLARLPNSLRSASTSRPLVGTMNAALATSLRPADQATAQFIRGSARLVLGEAQLARQDLQRALEGPLPTSLQAAAFNNLAIAWLDAEEPEEAERALRQATKERNAPAAVAMNLGILLDQHLAQPEAALAQYDAYLASSDPEQRDEVADWAQRLRAVYP